MKIIAVLVSVITCLQTTSIQGFTPLPAVPIMNRLLLSIPRQRSFITTTARFMSGEPRKAGVASPEELRAFVQAAGSKLLVVDVRNPDAEMEPGDQKSIKVAGLPSPTFRPQAIGLIYDRTTNSMPLPEVAKDTPIITHCGGGGRGQIAKNYLEEHGFTLVLNGGGPKETECWTEYGDK
jgi:rhodanese-related sulfurtransferase